MSNLKVLINGIVNENPTFVLMLGMCPTLGTTSSAINGMSMGLATAFVLICSNTVISAVKNLIPNMVRIPSFIVIIASFVTLLQMVMQAYVPDLYKTLGLFIPLIVVNCIVLGRAEAFASKNGPISSFFDGLGIPIWATSIVMITIILIYTFRSGLRTVVWTDLLQTTFLIGALIITLIVIMRTMGSSFSELWGEMATAGKGGTDCRLVWNTDWNSNCHFLKQIIGGMFITIAMTGLDQDMMQKNLSCKSLKDAQRNIFSFTGILVAVNVLFLLLGALLLVFAQRNGIDISNMPTDRIYPEIAFKYIGKLGAIVFIFGLISAGFSSADGTFTALTTSVCYDILKIQNRQLTDERQARIRRIVHVVIALLFLSVIIFVSSHHKDALIRIIFKVASYTYGPLLGLFIFGMFTKREIPAARRFMIPVISLAIPAFCYVLASYSQQWFNGFQFGYELLIVNGMLVFISLLAISRKSEQ